MPSRFPSFLALVLTLSVGASALSGPEASGTPQPRLGPEDWKDGWSLLAGAGFTRTRLYTENQSREQEGHGPNLMTSVGYCDRDAYCLELGSIVTFAYYEDLFATPPSGDEVNLDAWFWETALFASVRTRLPGVEPNRQFNPWVKLLSGYGASVGYPHRLPSEFPDSLRDMRMHTEGPLYGVSVMNLFNHDRPGRLWFLEGTAMVQLNWNNWLIKEGGLTPEVVQTGHTEGNPFTFFPNLTVGIRLF